MSDDSDHGTNGGPERDPESGRFVSPSTDSPDRSGGTDSERGRGRPEERSPRDENATDGGVSAPPPRQLSEQEVRAFLRDVLEHASAEGWYGASDGQPSSPPERPGGGRGRVGGAGEGERQAESGECATVLTGDDVEALEAEGYVVRDVPPVVGSGRTVTDSYALVTVETPDDEAVDPERSVDEVLSDVADETGSPK